MKQFSYDLVTTFDCITSNNQKENWMKTVRKRLCSNMRYTVICLGRGHEKNAIQSQSGY